MIEKYICPLRVSSRAVAEVSAGTRLSVNAKELLNYQIDWLGVISVSQYLRLIINFICAPINAEKNMEDMPVKRFVAVLTEHCKKKKKYPCMMVAGKKKQIACLKDNKIPPKRRL